jgi:hypothetical protein
MRLAVVVLVVTLGAAAAPAGDSLGPTHGVTRTIRCDGVVPYPIRIECDEGTYRPGVGFSRPWVAAYVETSPDTAVGFMRPIKPRTRTTRDGVTRYAARRPGARFRARFDGDVLTRMRFRARPTRYLDPQPPFDAVLRLTEADVTEVTVLREAGGE